MSKKAVVELFFDVISPYSWVSFESFLKYETVLPITLQLRPFSLGFVMHGSGNQAPAKIPAKGVNMFRELDLISKYWGFQMKAPSDFEETILRRGSMQAQRFLVSLQMKRPECLRPAARELWSRVWLRDEPIHEIKHIKEVCEKLSIPGADEIIENASSQQVKEALKRNTDEALDSGAFGAPWIILKREGHPDLPFFGSDRLPIICDLLGCEYRGPLRNADTHVKSRI